MFTDPTAQVQFTNPKTGKVWNWTAPEWPFLTGVTLAYEFARQASLQLTFDAPYEDAIERLLVIGSPFALGTQVDARIGYASRADWWTDWFSGFLMAGGDGLALDANGLSGSVNVQVISKGAKYAISETPMNLITNATMIEILYQAGNLVAGDEGTVSVSPGVREIALAKAASADDPAMMAWNPTAYASMTAWNVVKDICGILTATYWIGPDMSGKQALHIATERELTTGAVFKQKPPGTADKDAIATFRLRGILDPATGQYPLLTWAPEGAAWATWLAGDDDQAGKGVNVAYIDKDTGNVVEVPASATDRQVATVGSLATPGPEAVGSVDPDAFPATGDITLPTGGQPVQVSAPMPAGDAGLQRAQLAANRRQIAGSPSQVGTITTIGIPWIIPGVLVNLLGCGAIYDGLYLVQKATHTWAGANYETSMTVWRQGAVDKIGEKIPSPVGEMTA